MKPFEGLSLEQWEARKTLKDASRMYFLGEQVAVIFDNFSTALYYLHLDSTSLPGWDWELIKRGF